jgi:peptide subunit release factor 1 (eRF1)
MARDHEMHVLAHVRHAVDALARMDAGDPARRVLVGGPEEVLSAFARLLPKHLRSRVHPALRLPVAAAPARVLEQAREANRALERESEERLVAEVLSEGRARAALGAQSVVEAVNEKRARLLLLTEDVRLAGSECPHCQSLFADSTREYCPVCGAELRWVPDLVPALQEAVLKQDGRIQEVREGAARSLAVHGGIAARVRYPSPTILTA